MKPLQGMEHKAMNPRCNSDYMKRYIFAGSSQITLSLSYRISPSSVSNILRETLSAIWDELVEEYMPIPDQQSWKEKAQEFYDLWNFPHCCGALDGKHVRMKNLAKCGSENYNYKHFYSMLLLISADAKYKITYCDIGACGSSSDIGVLECSEFGKALLQGQLPLPPTENLPNSNISNPYVFIGDGGFPLKPNIMRPYPMDRNMTEDRKALNYRLSRARRVAENTFGILAARMRIFHTEIDAKADLCVLIIKAAVVLHNFLMDKSDLFEITTDKEQNGELILGNWRDITANDVGYQPATRLGSNNYTRNAEEIRHQFTQYFTNPEHRLPWQNEYIQRGNH